MVEPVFTIKAKDNLSLSVINFYREQCRRAELFEQAIEVDRAIVEIEIWRKDNSDECKSPDHKHVPASCRKIYSGKEEFSMSRDDY